MGKSAMRIKTTGAILLLWIYLTARPAVWQTTEPSPSVAEFARQVEAIFRAGDGKALASVTDRQAFARRATVGSETA